MNKSAYFLAGVASLAALWSVPAFAQEGAGEPANDRGDIVVTARKRQESILKVPVVETVISAEQLTKTQVTDIRNVVTQVPGLQVGNNVLTVGPQISLRGVGTSALDAGVDQSVSLNIDGLQFTQGATFNVGLFDMSQIEVLKGPQALFYGKNSPGGVISIRTADPTSEVEVIGRAAYEFRAREKSTELILSGPVTETLGLRIAGRYSDDDGYFRNYATALPGTGARDPSSTRYNQRNEYIIRGTAVWKPTNEFSARLKINNARSKVLGGSAPYGGCPDGTGAPAGIPFINPNDDCKIDRVAYIVELDPAFWPNIRNNGRPFLTTRQTFGTLELAYASESGINLTSTTGYFHTTVDGMLNGVNSGYAGPTLIADNHFKRRDVTQELRIESDFTDKPVNYLLGLYYQNASLYNRVFVGGNTAYGLPGTLTAGINDVSVESTSIFGQLRWQVVPELEVAFGARWTDEKRHDDGYRMTSLIATPTQITLVNPDLASSNVSPELTVTYTPTDTFTVFGALKQGYKSGSFIMTSPPSVGVDNSFGDERVRGGEIGFKSRLADNQFNVNAAFYYYKYAGLQVGANEIAQGGIPVIRTINAASSKVYGIDFDVAYFPRDIDGLSAKLGVNWNKARFEKFDNAQCIGGQTIADGCNLLLNPNTGLYSAQDLSGQPLPKAADWQINGSIDYDLPVGDDMTLGFSVNGQYSSKFLRTLGKRDDFYQPAFAKIGASVSLKGKNDAWEVALIGTNLTDKYTAGNCTNFSGATGQIFLSPTTGGAGRNAAGIDELACIVDTGRQIFLRLTLRPLGL